jgi:putative transposase
MGALYLVFEPMELSAVRRDTTRRAVYTTNAIESLNYSLRKVLKGRSAFPNDESIIKVLYMGLQHVAKKWTQPIPEWKAALNQFVILFGERVQV